MKRLIITGLMLFPLGVMAGAFEDQQMRNMAAQNQLNYDRAMRQQRDIAYQQRAGDDYYNRSRLDSNIILQQQYSNPAQSFYDGYNRARSR